MALVWRCQCYTCTPFVIVNSLFFKFLGPLLFSRKRCMVHLMLFPIFLTPFYDSNFVIENNQQKKNIKKTKQKQDKPKPKKKTKNKKNKQKKTKQKILLPPIKEQ